MNIMTHKTLVSVLMPSYNCAPFIGAAIESVLAQTFSEFELLVIDDGSTDRTTEIVTRYADSDSRVRLIGRDHYGLVETLNYGLDLARGCYLARLDSDDITTPQRLEVQKNFLDAHPEVVIIGSAYVPIDQLGVSAQVSFMPQSDVAIHWHSLFQNPFAHSSVMLRLDVLKMYGLSYDPAMQEAEDYSLWSQLLQHGRGYNLPQPLVQYRQHPEQASHQGRSGVWEFAGRVAQRNLIALGMPLPIEAVQRLRDWFYRFPARFVQGDHLLAESLLGILNRFSSQPGLDHGEVERIRGRWLGKIIRASSIKDPGWLLHLIGHLQMDDFRAVLAYLRVRERPMSW
jgi:Glycosyl transferase family 2